MERKLKFLCTPHQSTWHALFLVVIHSCYIGTLLVWQKEVEKGTSL